MHNLKIGGGWKISWNKLPDIGTFEFGPSFESLFCAVYREDFLVTVDWYEPRTKKQKRFHSQMTYKGNMLDEKQSDNIEDVLSAAQAWIDELSLGRTDINEIFHTRTHIEGFPKKILKNEPLNTYSATAESGNYYFTADEYAKEFPKDGGTWKVTLVKIFDTQTNEKIGEYLAEYHRKPHAWVTKDDNDYLFLTEAMEGQSVFDCKNRTLHSHFTGSNPYIWAEILAAPDANKLAILGCVWADAYEVVILDISDITTLPYPELARFEMPYEWEMSHWNSNVALVLKDKEGFSTNVFPYNDKYVTESVVEIMDIQNVENERLLARIDDESGEKRLISFILATNSVEKADACYEYFKNKDYEKIEKFYDAENGVSDLYFEKYQVLDADELENFTCGMINLAASFFDMFFASWQLVFRLENETKIIEIAQQEVLIPTFETTKQYLKKYKIALENGKPKIKNIRHLFDNEAVVYFEIKNNPFYLAIYVENYNIKWVDTQANTQVYFSAVSTHLTLKDFGNWLKIAPTRSVEKGKKRKGGKGEYDFTAIYIEPKAEPTLPFHVQLFDLLDLLETDKFGIKTIADKTNATINVCTKSYVKNGEIGGFHLDKKTMKRIADLGLAIDFDTYVSGKML